MPPRVSVVIPTHNNARWLPATVDSVLAQDFEGEVEIIVVDDGSTDDTPRVLESLAARSGGRVESLRQDNAGPGTARNRGLARARGFYVAFLDDDDLWRPDFLKRMAGFLDAHPEAGSVFCDLEEFSERGVVHPSFLAHRKHYSYLPKEPGIFREAFRANLLECVMLFSAMLCRTDLVRRAGGFLEDRRTAEDMRLISDLSLAAPMGCIPEKLVRRHLHENNYSKNRHVVASRTLRVLADIRRDNAEQCAPFRRELAAYEGKLHFDAGYGLYEASDYGGALGHFCRSLGRRFSAAALYHALAALAAALLGPRIYGWLRGLKKRLSP